MNNSGPGTVDAERVSDLKEVGSKIGLDPAEVVSLLEQHGLSATETAIAEASRAGDRLYAPAAFAKRRAAALARAAANEADFNSRRSASIDREHRERIAAGKSDKLAAETDMAAVDAEIARIPPEALAGIKELALQSMGDVPRSVAKKRGFEGSPTWRIAAAKIWREGLTRHSMLA
jgi:hypothetical protein